MAMDQVDVRIEHVITIGKSRLQRRHRGPQEYKKERNPPTASDDRPKEYRKTQTYEESLLMDPVGVSERLIKLREYGIHSRRVAAGIRADVAPGLLRADGTRARQPPTIKDKIISNVRRFYGRVSDGISAVWARSTELKSRRYNAA